MHNGKFIPTPDQENLIRSLQSKFHRETDFTTQNTMKKIHERTQSSLGTVGDNLRFISRYICSCGTQTETVSHSTSCNLDGSAIDTYELNCKSCGKEEKINFHMLKQALEESKNSSKISNKKSALYPYL